MRKSPNTFPDHIVGGVGKVTSRPAKPTRPDDPRGVSALIALGLVLALVVVALIGIVWRSDLAHAFSSLSFKEPSPGSLAGVSATSEPVADYDTDEALNIDAASAYADGRPLVALAVLDRQTRTYLDNGTLAHSVMGSASVIKVVIAEELLHRAEVGQMQLGDSELGRIQTMLRDSNACAASSLYSQFGGISLIAAALERHQLTESSPPANPRYWGNTMVTAHDIVKFYANVFAGSISKANQDYLFGLLRNTAPVATDGFGQLFGMAGLDPSPVAAVKQGWMCCLDGVRNLHSTAVVGEQDRYVVVILTQYPTSLPYAYGKTTTTEVARLVLDELQL